MQKRKKTNYIVLILFLLYLALLIWIIVFKLQFSITDLDCAKEINLIPFYYEKEVNFHAREVIENVLIFVPMGIYLQMFLPKLKFRTKLITIVGISFLLETAQYALAIGRSDITDLLTNSAGGFWGLAIYSMAAQLLGNRNKADKLFSVMASIASTIVIGLLAFILFANW